MITALACLLAAVPGALFAAGVDRVLRPAPAAPVRAAHARAAAARFEEIPPGARWLACDTTTCGHLTTRHVPDGDAYRCAECKTRKGAQQ
ncbi:hypothetical protein AB0F64_37595 [Streptomyces sp. NPDC026294]|uniref:hypothetical protein n=1 Tax=Streptomyces sp. NPDC026294 TaxID=3155362 RepID=UPI0033F0A38A